MTDCKMVVFSDRAYNAIIRETFEWDPVETGGILLGHILDNGCWIVMEVLPPGYSEGRKGCSDNVHHDIGYFEYNQTFVNYLVSSVAKQYKVPLELLGLWHRHPGSMDYFSSTDDITNRTFASLNPKGAISGLINIDPQLRLTMYHIEYNDGGIVRPNYQQVNVEYGSDIIPKEYFELKFFNGDEKDIHPSAPNRRNANCNTIRAQNLSQHNVNEEVRKDLDIVGTIDYIISPKTHDTHTEHHLAESADPFLADIKGAIENVKKKKWKIIFLLIAIIVFLLSLKKGIGYLWNFTIGTEKVTQEAVLQERNNEDDENLYNFSNAIVTIEQGDSTTLRLVPRCEVDVKWNSTDKNIATVNEKGLVKGMSSGKVDIQAVIETRTITCKVIVKDTTKAN